MDELLAFAHARLDDDEASGLRVKASWRQEGETGVILASDGTHAEVCAEARWSGIAEHILRHDPARTLRDVQARRTTLVRCQEEMLSGIPRLVWFAKMTVWEMVQRWADHDDYKEDWKP